MSEHALTKCVGCGHTNVYSYGGDVFNCLECGFEWSDNAGSVTALELLGIAHAVCGTNLGFASRLRRAADELAALQRPTEGCLRIMVERQRQIEAEGRTPATDAAYVHDELARAAACYALPITDDRRREVVIWGGTPEGWPFPREAWKPARVIDAGGGEAAVSSADRIRELEKAGALIAAEIDRLTRVINQGPTA